MSQLLFVLLLTLRSAHALVATPAITERRTVPFPKRVLREYFEDPQPGKRIDSPPFVVDGSRWLVSLYPNGGNPSYDGLVGLYLRLLQPEGGSPLTPSDAEALTTECDATFSLQLRAEDGEKLGSRFSCGMTFCCAAEAGECELPPSNPRDLRRPAVSRELSAVLAAVGRCEDWGAHVYATTGLQYEVDEAREVCVDVELSLWAQRPTQTGAALKSLAEQVCPAPAAGLDAARAHPAAPLPATSRR